MKTRPLAAVDIGTNTFRLLIAMVRFDRRKNNYAINEMYSERIITRLGEGVCNRGRIKEAAIMKSISTLKKFSEIIDHYGTHKTAALATSALRDALNSDTFLKKAREATGLDIQIIPGEEEAKKTASGMLIGLKVPKTALMADIGGGSTELIFSRQREPELVRSLNLGVVYLAEKYMKKDPPTKKALNLMGQEISQKILSISDSFRKFFTRNTAFIGTAGTVTALSAIAQNLASYDHGKIHNSKITFDTILTIFTHISTITAKQRIRYLPFEPSRLDIIVPGTLILLKLMEVFGFESITVSNYGLREGIIIDLFHRNR
jgi:exopolyphosphatase/guanosine-5'-triphosphate,3'-diphosphate pyrophosphatase